MGKIIGNFDLVGEWKHLKDMPKDRILLDDITKLYWKWDTEDDNYNTSPVPLNYPESHHVG